MTEVPTTRLRIFSPDEFSGPDNWPEDVGIAVLVAGEPEIFPVHLRENGQAIIDRIGALTGLDLRGVAVFPPVEGHPECDLPFTAVARLRSEIESFLSRTPDAVEEAADFSVNFGFAVEEGLDLSALVRTGTPVADTPPEPVLPEPAGLPGFLPFDPSRPETGRVCHATLRPLASGGYIVDRDVGFPSVTVGPADLLVRADGTGLAIRCLPEQMPGRFILPDGCLGIEVPSRGMPAIIARQDGYLLVTPVPGPADVDQPEPMTQREPITMPALFRLFAAVRPQGFAMLACLFAGLSIFVFSGEEATAAKGPSDPVHLLRTQLFD